MHTVIKVTKRYNRCLDFTLSDGTVIEVKVAGDKYIGKLSCDRLEAALATLIYTPTATEAK